MYKNQYFASNIKMNDKFLDFNKIKIGNIYFYLSPDLLNQYVTINNVEILLLGYIIDPFNSNNSDEQTINYIANHCTTKDKFISEIKNYSGRFVVVYKNNDSFIVCCDAVHFRQVYYNFQNENISLTSNLKMFLDYFDLSLTISEEKRMLMKSDVFQKREHVWFGENSYDDRVKKLLPNHYLDLKNKKVKRLPYFFNDFLKNDADYVKYTADILKNTYIYLSKHFNLIQPLTAGLDTRMLLAASKDFKDKIIYYIFVKNNNTNVADIYIPKNLSKQLNINFEVYSREQLKTEFLDIYTKEHAFPRVIPKLANVQHHYYKYLNNKNTISISGVVGEVIRGFYGYTKNDNINSKVLYEFSRYAGKSKYILNEIENWLSEAKNYANENEISILDLFYWEQRLGNWGALYPFEQDIAIEENSPFNNRSLLMNIHRISYKKRRAPRYLFFIDLINELWSQVLCQPINPDRYKIVDIIKDKSFLRYQILKIKRKIID